MPTLPVLLGKKSKVFSSDGQAKTLKRISFRQPFGFWYLGDIERDFVSRSVFLSASRNDRFSQSDSQS